MHSIDSGVFCLFVCFYRDIKDKMCYVNFHFSNLKSRSKFVGHTIECAYSFTAENKEFDLTPLRFEPSNMFFLFI